MTRFLIPVVTGAAAMALSAGLLAQAQQPPVPNPFKSVEYLVLGDATRGAGEPMIAVDPTNPRNIIVVAMGTYTELPAGPDGRPLGQGSIPRSTINWLGVTHDGGKNWKVGEQPILTDSFTRCPDAIADVTKDGTFLAGCEPRETSGPSLGLSAMQMSDDRGDTWGRVIEIIPQWDRHRFAPGLRPRMQGASPYDRPFLHVDDSTGVIYGVAEGGTAEEGNGSRLQAYLTALVPGTRTFGTIYAWDSPDYPQQSRGLGSSMQHGVVYVGYNASSAPASEGATCPCPVIGVSRDQGKTITRRVVKSLPTAPANRIERAVPGPGGAPPAPFPPTTRGVQMSDLSADPTKAGRVAILAVESGPTPRLHVTVSEDSGTTWGSLVGAGSTPNAIHYDRTMFEYSRDGVLGVMWRAMYRDSTYDIWAAISKDGGKTFSKSLQVSHVKSPSGVTGKGIGNDDIIDFMMDKENMHLVWGDFRSGFLASWYGRVALSAFEF